MIIGTLTSDLRYGARSLLRAPLFTLMAIVTFALGAGANTAVFSILHAAFLSPLPYPDADRLVRVWPERPLSVREFIQLQQETAALSGVAASSDEVFTVGGDGPAEEVAGAAVTTDYFTLLGARPALGRLFTAGDSIAGADPAVILSHEFWEHRFGRDQSVVGRRIAIGGQGTAERRVVGVLTPDFAPVLPASRLGTGYHRPGRRGVLLASGFPRRGGAAAAIDPGQPGIGARQGVRGAPPAADPRGLFRGARRASGRRAAPGVLRAGGTLDRLAAGWRGRLRPAHCLRQRDHHGAGARGGAVA